MKKIAILGVATLGLLFGGQIAPAHAEETKVTSKQELKKEQSPNYNESKVKDGDKIKSHVGEKPLFTQKNEKTGVTVNAYPSKETSVSTYLTDTPGWDYRGQEWWRLTPAYDDYYERDWTYLSTGGQYCITVPGHYAYTQLGDPTMEVQLWEEDYGYTGDDWVDTFYVHPSSSSIDYVVSGIGNFVDGTDGTAELYTYRWSNYTTFNGGFNVSYWD